MSPAAPVGRPLGAIRPQGNTGRIALQSATQYSTAMPVKGKVAPPWMEGRGAWGRAKLRRSPPNRNFQTSSKEALDFARTRQVLRTLPGLNGNSVLAVSPVSITAARLRSYGAPPLSARMEGYTKPPAPMDGYVKPPPPPRASTRPGAPTDLEGYKAAPGVLKAGSQGTRRRVRVRRKKVPNATRDKGPNEMGPIKQGPNKQGPIKQGPNKQGPGAG